MPQIHEKTSMNSSEMSALIEAAKEQSLKRSITRRSVSVPEATYSLPESTDIRSAEHGSYVQMSDGIGAIVVDHEVELKKQQENDKTGKRLLNLLSSNSLITDANEYVPDYGENAPDGYDPGVQFIEENPYDTKAMQLREIKSNFANLVPGINGLVPADSDEGKIYAEAMHKLESGEIILPTPEEYEQQKREAEMKRAEARKNRRDKAKESLSTNTVEPTLEHNELDEEPQMGEMPENAIIKKGVDKLVNALDNNNTINKEVEQVSKPFNLAMAETELEDQIEQEGVSVPEENAPEVIKPSEVVTINVPAGEADTVMEHLPLESYEKIERAKVIKVNEVELKNVPTATTRITDLASYKRLSKRRPNIKTAEITERVLINSGFVVTLKGATSLEMATIFTSPTSTDIDWEKEYIFCYEHTVGTSIGKLSYNEFIVRVSPKDIETILDGIYEISETDTRKISIRCGTNDGGCGESYDVDCVIADLPDIDNVNKETSDRIKEIVNAKGSVDESKLIADKSPSSIVKHIQCGDRIINIRATTGSMMIERIDMLDSLSEKYGAIVAFFLLYVESITVTLVSEIESIPDKSYLLDTLDLICQEILTLNDEELECVKNVITDGIPEYDTITYSIKGPCRCPNCGNVKDKIPCSISDLVFQKAQSVLA